MSEQLLKAVIRLFALLARLDGVGDRERTAMYNLIDSKLNKEVVPRFMEMFNHFAVSKLTAGKDLLDEIIAIAREINGQITHQQKIVLLSDLTQLVFADNVLSEKERNALYHIGSELNIDTEELHAIRNFVTGKHIDDFNSSKILIITNSKEIVPEKCRHITPDGYIDGFVAVLYLKSIKPFFMKYYGMSSMFLNQTPVDSGKIVIVPTGSALRGNGFKAIYYSDMLGQFRDDLTGTRITFRAEDLYYQFKKGGVGLRGVTLSEKNGSLIGIMGASGAGKSTLINILNGNEKPSAGRVLINGIDIHREGEKIKGVIGYVPQDDLLMEDLTVFENLYYAAKLCFSNYSEARITSLVNKTLTNLGLFEIRNLKVGNPLDKIISGGQRKRLNIGLELLREPMVLYVDEPTSGLSSRDSENIMDLLKEICLRGKLVFVVIHQPSSDIFKMFDKLLILDVGGYPIFYGNPMEATVYFREVANLVDKETGACAVCGNVNVEQIFNIIETKVMDEYGMPTAQRKITPASWYEIYKKRVEIPEPEDAEEPPESVLFIPSRLSQLMIFATRDLKSKLANRQYVLINLLEAPLLALILAVLVKFYTEEAFKPSEYVFQYNVNIPAYMFMAVVVALFIGLTVSAEEIIRDRKILKRESFLHLSRTSYLASKIMLLFMLSAIQVITFVLIGNWILGIKEMNFAFWLVLFSAACFANVLGLNISSSFNSVVAIYIVIPLLLIPQILLSGVVVQFDQLNPLFGSKSKVPVIGDMMASRWAFEAMMVHQFKDNKFERMFYDVDKEVALSDYNTLYYLPRLASMLDYVFTNRESRDRQTKESVAYYMLTLRNEIAEQLKKYGRDKFAYLENLYPDKLDSVTYESAKKFFDTLKRIHINRNKKAMDEKNRRIAELTSTPKKAAIFNKMRRDHTNDQVTSMVFDNKEKTRILEYNGRLIQQIYPIFSNPEPSGFFDFRTLFYMPQKHFAGQYFDTLYFNVVIIWLMTILLMITLYFDALRKLLELKRDRKSKPE